MNNKYWYNWLLVLLSRSSIWNKEEENRETITHTFKYLTSCLVYFTLVGRQQMGERVGVDMRERTSRPGFELGSALLTTLPSELKPNFPIEFPLDPGYMWTKSQTAHPVLKIAVFMYGPKECSMCEEPWDDSVVAFDKWRQRRKHQSMSSSSTVSVLVPWRRAAAAGRWSAAAAAPPGPAARSASRPGEEPRAATHTESEFTFTWKRAQTQTSAVSSHSDTACTTTSVSTPAPRRSWHMDERVWVSHMMQPRA